MEQLTIDADEAAIRGWEILDHLGRSGWAVTFIPLPGFAGGVMVEVDGGWERKVRMRGDSVAEVAPLILDELRATYGWRG
jgi:hypothetical protein